MSIDLDQETQCLIELEIQAGGFRDASAFVSAAVRHSQCLIELEIQAGGFRDASAFVSAAVRHFLITRADLGSTREQIDAMLASAVSSLERGEGVDGEEFFAELEREEHQLHRQQG